MKLFCFCENKTKVETYSKEKIDEKFLGNVVKIVHQRYYSSTIYNPDIKLPISMFPADWYDNRGIPNYILIGGYVGSYTSNGDVLGEYNPVNKYLDVQYSHDQYGLSGSLQGFGVSGGFTLDMALYFKKVR